LKYTPAASYTTVSILVVMLAVSLLSNQNVRGQITAGNKSESAQSVNVNLNETGDKILQRGIAVSERFNHPYLNNTQSYYPTIQRR
jgi:hypothetical protein